jgi:predicted MFS family arabinose efflux permease
MDLSSSAAAGSRLTNGNRSSSTEPAKLSMPSGALVLLLAITAGLVVMNIYYNQPILNEMAATFKTTPPAIAWVATVTQLGYAAGLLFILPLGDSIDRKHVIIGGSLGSLIGAQALALAGWSGVCATGIILALVGLSFLYRRTDREKDQLPVPVTTNHPSG